MARRSQPNYSVQFATEVFFGRRSFAAASLEATAVGGRPLTGRWAMKRSDHGDPQHLPDEHFTTLSTHVLDAVRGGPATGLAVKLLSGDDQVASGRTGPDGRLSDLASGLEPGVYRLIFETGEYYGADGHLFRRVSLDVALTERRHYHVPLLLSPFSVTSYRGA